MMRATFLSCGSYNGCMARGWESKSVESQQELARDEQSARHRALSDEQKKLAREREGLLLSRARVIKQIEASTNERYTKVLREALNEIEQKIASLEGL
jgi:hypothetical protein